MLVESIIEVANRILLENKSETETLDTLRIQLEPYIYHHLLSKYSSKFSEIWLNYIPPKHSNYAYVIVERRCHPNFEFILKNMAWANPNMSVYIFCSSENIDFIKTLLGSKKLPYFNIIQIFAKDQNREQGKKDYNNLLTSKQFYTYIEAEYILTIQMDVFIRQPIPDSIFCGHYWGAPWGWKSEFPGGGGATIRKISTMREISRDSGDPEINTSEDGWMCEKIMKSYQYPSLEFRANHIMESIPVNNPIVIHQFWTFYASYVYTMDKATILGYWNKFLTIAI